MSDGAAVEQMEAAKKLLMDVVKEMYEENNFRIPAVKRVRSATGLSLAKAKDLLEECKPLLKKTKATPLQDEQTPSEKSADEEVKHEPAESEPAEKETNKTKKEQSVSQASFSPEQPDNQEGLSPEDVPGQPGNGSPQPTDLDSLSQKAQLETQRRPWLLVFCCWVVAVERFLQPLAGPWTPCSMGRIC